MVGACVQAAQRFLGFRALRLDLLLSCLTWHRGSYGGASDAFFQSCVPVTYILQLNVVCEGRLAWGESPHMSSSRKLTKPVVG